MDFKRIDQHYQNGRNYFNMSDYNSAIQQFNIVIGLYSDHVASYLLRGASYSKLGKFDLARSDLNFVLQFQFGGSEVIEAKEHAKKELAEVDKKQAAEAERKERERRELLAAEEERKRKEQEELERKEREHQEWLKTEEGQKWLAAEEERKRIEQEEHERREAEKIKKSIAEKPLRIISMSLCIISSIIFFFLIHITGNISVMIGSVINGFIICCLMGICLGDSIAGKIGMGIFVGICGGLIGLLLGWLLGLLGGLKIIWAIFTFLFCFVPLGLGYTGKNKSK